LLCAAAARQSASPRGPIRARGEARAGGAGKSAGSAIGATNLIFTGEQPSDAIPGYLDAADVLVSPRSSGTNTPLKIYQYLRSGRVIVATRLLTHTQVLSDEVAILTEATPESFGCGILQAINDPAAARRIGEAAKLLAETRYTYEAYLQRTREACAALVA
jgi:glycosyltransferase involved in cell wall biosynthesis